MRGSPECQRVGTATPARIDAPGAAGIRSSPMVEFRYVEPFPVAKDETPYRKLASEHVSVATFEGQEVLKVAPEAEAAEGAPAAAAAAPGAEAAKTETPKAAS